MANDKKFVVKNGLHSTGDITVTGTVDGRDVAADGITLDGLGTTSNAYADQAELDAIASAEAKDVVRATAANTYADDAITALVDGAPGTLDTLNELAAALGDDPNFADTINTSLATKSTIVLSDTAPVSPTPISGDLWFDTTDGSLNVYYNDGSSSQWVSTSGPAGATGPAGSSYSDSDVGSYLNGNLSNHIIPDSNDTYDIGSAAYKIRDLYVSDNSIHIGDSTLRNLEGSLLINGEDVMDYNNFINTPPAETITLATLQSEVAASVDFADFQDRIAGL